LTYKIPQLICPGKMKTIAVLLVLVPAAAFTAVHSAGSAGHVSHTSLRKDAGAKGFVRALAFEFKLRICNAYPAEDKLAVSKGKDDLVKGEEALAYQSCVDLKPDLKAGDKLDFKLGGSEAGTFTITDLPQNDATLLLVVHRHDVQSSTVSFESHVFANLQNSQIAVIDAYTGTSKSVVKIQDHQEKESKSLPRQEELRYDSVVAVNPGDYECVLYDAAGKEKSKARLVALGKESYIVLRTGVEDTSKPYEQSLVVYPKSDDPNKGSAPAPFMKTALLLVLASALFSLQP